MPGEMTMSWAMLMALGAFHGINPGMGWLFAVALGMQEGRTRAVWRALPPLALGHAVAVAAAVLTAAVLGRLLPPHAIVWIVGGMLLGLGALRLVRHRHPRYGGMRVGFRELTIWSFLMATAHGAGLMLVPVMLGLCAPMPEHGPALAVGDLRTALLVAAVHTAAMLLAGVVIAWAVYSWLGLKFLRQAWLNLDLAWAASLVVAGGAGIWMAV